MNRNYSPHAQESSVLQPDKSPIQERPETVDFYLLVIWAIRLRRLAVTEDRNSQSQQEDIMNKKEAYQKQVEAKLNEWKAEVDKLRAKADQADMEMRIKYHEQIDELQARKKEVRSRLDSLQRAGEESWQELKKGLEEASDSLSKAFSSIKSKFN